MKILKSLGDVTKIDMDSNESQDEEDESRKVLNGRKYHEDLIAEADALFLGEGSIKIANDVTE